MDRRVIAQTSETRNRPQEERQHESQTKDFPGPQARSRNTSMGIPVPHTSSAVCSSQSGVAQEQRRLLASHWWVSHACPKIANLTPIITLHHFIFHFSLTRDLRCVPVPSSIRVGRCSVAIHVGSWTVLYNPSHLLIFVFLRCVRDHHQLL